MKFAVTLDGRLELPRRQLEGVCPDCGDKMIPVCGPVMQHHWRHRNLEVCIESNRECEGQWHREWKAFAPEVRREITVTRNGRVKRADIKPRVRNSFIELQHSHMSQEQVIDRDDFYGTGLIWMFDADGRQYRTRRVAGADFRGYPEYVIDMHDVVGMAFDTTRVSTIDLGSDVCRLLQYPYCKPGQFHAIIVPAERVANAIKASCNEVEPILADFWNLKPESTPIRRAKPKGKWDEFEPALKCTRKVSTPKTASALFDAEHDPGHWGQASYGWRFMNH